MGWLTGASKSPVVPIIAPLVFGLLAVLGASASLRRKFDKRAAIWRGLFVAFMVLVFCYCCYYGVRRGNISRVGPYKSMKTLVGDAWETIDDDTASEVYQFRLKCRAQTCHLTNLNLW